MRFIKCGIKMYNNITDAVGALSCWISKNSYNVENGTHLNDTLHDMHVHLRQIAYIKLLKTVDIEFP